MQFRGFEFTEDEVESVTIRRSGTYVTISRDDCISNKVQGFAARPAKPITEGKICKGGLNPPYDGGPRPPAPGGSGVRPPKPEPPDIELRREC